MNLHRILTDTFAITLDPELMVRVRAYAADERTVLADIATSPNPLQFVRAVSPALLRRSIPGDPGDRAD
jgi:hypothetical protein